MSVPDIITGTITDTAMDIGIGAAIALSVAVSWFGTPGVMAIA